MKSITRPAVTALAAGALLVPLAPATVSSAEASSYRVTVSPKRNLAGDGATWVTISGLPKRVGVYVRLCVKQPAGGRPSASECLGGNDRSGIWAIQKYPYPGTRPANTVKPRKGPFRLPIRKKFGGYNCKRVACVVHVRRDHQNGADRSYDRNIRVRF